MTEALGFYVPGTSWLHRLNPFPKLLGTVWGVTAPFVFPIATLPAFLAGSLALGLSTGLGRRYLRALALGTLPIVGSIVLVNGFFFPGARDVLVSIGPFNLTSEGLAFGLPVAARVVAAVAVTLAFVTTTRPDDLMEALIEQGASPKLAFVVLSTLQTVPRMLAKASRILDAQQSRGLATRGSIRARARAIVPLVGPLIVGSLVDVRERALALEARAFGAAHRRTAYRVVPMTPIDRLATRVVVVGLALLPMYLVAVAAGAIA